MAQASHLFSCICNTFSLPPFFPPELSLQTEYSSTAVFYSYHYQILLGMVVGNVGVVNVLGYLGKPHSEVLRFSRCLHKCSCPRFLPVTNPLPSRFPKGTTVFFPCPHPQIHWICSIALRQSHSLAHSLPVKELRLIVLDAT